MSLSTSRDAGRDKVAYMWISPDPAKTGPTLRGVIVVVVSHESRDFMYRHSI